VLKTCEGIAEGMFGLMRQGSSAPRRAPVPHSRSRAARRREAHDYRDRWRAASPASEAGRSHGRATRPRSAARSAPARARRATFRPSSRPTVFRHSRDSLVRDRGHLSVHPLSWMTCLDLGFARARRRRPDRWRRRWRSSCTDALPGSRR
jgi:hypothetical protein